MRSLPFVLCLANFAQKCSGERPVCSNCIKYKKQCEYGSGAKVAKVRALESRIGERCDGRSQA